jgi:hypothetical protein
MTIQFGGNKYNHGDEVIVSIQDSEFFKGKILVKNKRKFYICHNYYMFHSTNVLDKLGYLYNWKVELDENNESLSFLEKPCILHNVNIEKAEMEVYPKLNHFINRSFNLPLLNLKLGVIDDYDSITEAHGEPSSVELHSSTRNKKLTIKLGRLVRKLIIGYNKAIKDSINNPLLLTDEFIENLHNKWTSHNIELDSELLVGKDILKGYNSDNYTKDDCFESCMTDEFQYLKLYTKNPKQISLLVFYINKEICGRCLVWKADNGKVYHDRIYCSYDWALDAINQVIESRGLLPLTPRRTVTLDRIEFEYYPYMDSFKYASITKKRLTTYKTASSEYFLQDTDGEYTEVR